MFSVCFLKINCGSSSIRNLKKIDILNHYIVLENIIELEVKFCFLAGQAFYIYIQSIALWFNHYLSFLSFQIIWNNKCFHLLQLIVYQAHLHVSSHCFTQLYTKSYVLSILLEPPGLLFCSSRLASMDHINNLFALAKDR